MPRVSVIIPCYNYARYLPDAVESVVRQTYPDIEVIIVNDGSPDGTREVAEGLIMKYKDREIILVNQENSGLAASRNNGIQVARGEYVLPLDADDMLGPEYIEKCLSAMKDRPRAGLAYTWIGVIGNKSGVLECGRFTRRNLAVRNGPPQTLLIRKSAFEKVGGYKRMTVQGAEDWEIGCSLFESGCEGVVVEEPLLLYRKHGHSMINDMLAKSVVASRDVKLLHPAIFEPQLSKISVPLARAVIRLKSRVRDPLTHYIYVRFPRLHRAMSRIKYDLFGFMWKG